MKALWASLASVALAVAWQSPNKPAFEVASIKPSDPNPSNPMLVGMSADRAMVRYSNISLRDCIRAAFRVRDFQIEGPDWLSKARFEIDARLPQGASSDGIPEMMQQLLIDRFRLELRHETRDQKIYALLAAKGGAKLEPVDSKSNSEPMTALGPDGKPRPLVRMAVRPSMITLTAPSATLGALAERMSLFTVRPIIDMTGIEGQYRFNLNFIPETTRGIPGAVIFPDPPNEPQEPVPSIFDAIQQYGLRLESRRAPLEMLVITHVEKTPTEN